MRNFAIFLLALLLAGCVIIILPDVPRATEIPTNTSTLPSSPSSVPSTELVPMTSTETAILPTDLSPTETSTNTPILPTTTLEPTPTAENWISTEQQLRDCISLAGSVCKLNPNLVIELTSQLTITEDNITIVGGEITNAVDYPNRLTAVIGAQNVRFEGTKIRGTLANAQSSIKDCILVSSSTVVLSHVLIQYCEDENVDVQNGSNLLITYSVVIQPLRNAMHKSGSHAMDILVVDSALTVIHSVIGDAKERIPQCQNSTCTLIDTLIDNISNYGIQPRCGTVLTTEGLIVRVGLDTDKTVASYGIVATHALDCGSIDPLPVPQITEKCSLAVDWYITAAGVTYPRIRRLNGDAPYYINPIVNNAANIFKTDSSNCTMPNSDLSVFFAEIGQVPDCLISNTCRILDRRIDN